MGIIQAEHISLRLGNKPILQDISFRLKPGKTLCIIGSSGCGKTSLLKTINRLYEAQSGKIIAFGKNIKEIEEHQLRRRIGYVLQQPALFPHWTAAQNIALVPKLLKWDQVKIDARTAEVFDLVGLSFKEYSERYPHQMSGGQQQRVGIARALASNPELMLYDEPFSALDPISRRALQQTLLELKSRLNNASIFVTHDVNEAFLLADEIMVLQAGKIVQYGEPTSIRNAPANEYVRNFLAELHG